MEVRWGRAPVAQQHMGVSTGMLMSPWRGEFPSHSCLHLAAPYPSAFPPGTWAPPAAPGTFSKQRLRHSPRGSGGSTRSARDTLCLHRVSFPLITPGFLTLFFLQFFFMSAINLLSLMREHEFPWEESQLVVSHVNGAGAHVGCEGLVAGTVPTGTDTAHGMDVCGDITGSNVPAGF